METPQRSGSGVLILEKAAVFAADHLKRYRIPFLSTLLLGLLAYGFAFTNKLINHDEAASLFTKGSTVPSGRWGLGALDSIFPNYSMPWIYGILTVLIIALAVCLLVHVFRVKNNVLQVLLSGCIVAFPSLIGTFGYMFTATSFALSFLLAVSAAAMIRQPQKWCFIPALGCLIFSLCIYQAYISVAAGLLVLTLIQQLLKEEKPQKILLNGIYYVLFLVAALGLYYLATQVVLKITGVSMNGYASERIIFSLSSVLNGVVLAYVNFFRFFTEGFLGLIPTAFSRTLHLLLLVSLGWLLVQQLLRCGRNSLSHLILFLLLVAALPLAINCMYMITSVDSIHTLVLYGFVSVYVLTVILADHFLSSAPERSLTSIILNVLSTVMALIIAVNIYIANQSYLNLHLRYENASAFYTSLIADIKMNPGFDENTRLAVIGEYQQPDYYPLQFESIHTITGVYGFVPDNYSKDFFLTYYTGFPMEFASEEEISRIMETPEFDAMAVYPYYGSLQKIGDCLVVKLS